METPVNSEYYISVPSILYKELFTFPGETKEAVDHFINILTEYLHPIYLCLEKDCEKTDQSRVSMNKLDSNKMLCANLLSKYIKLMKEVFKKEAEYSCVLQDSRNWVLGRIEWTLKFIEKLKDSSQPTSNSIIMDCDGDKFISCVDRALDALENIKRSFENDLEKDLNVNRSLWKIQCTADLFNLHLYIKDTVSAAMKICQNCLSSDQNIIIARCHVVFRELKKFLTELTSKVNVNIDNFVIKVDDVKPKENLHYPTVRLLNDVLRDAIYNLEATTNRSVLTLVLSCMADPVQPLKYVIERSKCKTSSLEDENLLEEFDIHIERVIQIGLFSISCSADEKRIFMLRNCLINLEDLEVQMIPSVLSDPQSIHSDILIQQWTKEMTSLKLLVFLIIDPVALMDLVMEKFRLCLTKLKSQSALKWEDGQYLIGLGKCIFDYIEIYKVSEPTSLPHYHKIFSYAADLQKVLKECSVVCVKFLGPNNKGGTHIDDLKSHINNKDETINHNRILKRLKLLYAILLNISQQIIQDSACFEDDNVNNECSEDPPNLGETYTHKDVIGKLDNSNEKSLTNVTNTKYNKQNETKTLCNFNNQTFSRSTIMRIHNNSKSTNSVFVERNPWLSSNFYKKHEGSCVCNSASFASPPGEDFLLASISEEDMKPSKCFLLESILHEKINNLKPNMETSHFRRNQRKSLRKTLLMNKIKSNPISLPKNIDVDSEETNLTKNSCRIEEIGFTILDANTTDWHITEILEQLSHLSNTLSLMNIDIDKQLNNIQGNGTNTHVVKLKVNHHSFSSPKSIWNIQITGNDTTVENHNIEKFSSEVNSTVVQKIDANNEEVNHLKNNLTVNCGIDVSFGSNVPTPERLKDINQLEEKLANLKEFWKPKEKQN